MKHVVVAGGSIAAVTAAEALRLNGHDGTITVLSEEAHQPYSRVPLSKGLLRGSEDAASTRLSALSSDIDLRLNSKIVDLQVQQRRVLLQDDSTIEYDGLVIATGARARRLSMKGQRGEHVVRTLDDTAALVEVLATARTVVVVGGGFLGMEVASTCIDLGLQVTVVDRDPPLRRLVGRWLADIVVQRAKDRGVRFVLASDGVELLGGSRITGVDCGQGRRLDADVVVTAAGDLPNVEWLSSTGLAIHGGLVTDQFGRVAPGIVAAGDVTVQFEDGQARRTPHWTAAVQQAQVAAATLVRGEVTQPPRPVPYFWTHQFGLDVKISGLIPTNDQPSLLDGDPQDGSFLVQWKTNGQPVAAATVNRPMPIVKLKRLAAPPRTQR